MLKSLSIAIYVSCLELTNNEKKRCNDNFSELDFSLDELVNVTQILLNRLVSEFEKDFKLLEGLKRRRGQLLGKIKESEQRCNKFKARQESFYTKSQERTWGGGSSVITVQGAEVDDSENYLTKLKYRDEFQQIEGLKREMDELDAKIQECEQRCNKWNKQKQTLSATLKGGEQEDDVSRAVSTQSLTYATKRAVEEADDDSVIILN